MVVDPSMSEGRIFLNGVVVQDMTAPYSPSNDYFGQASRNWMIGSTILKSTSSTPIFGDVDEVGWDRALTDEEILACLRVPTQRLSRVADDTRQLQSEATEDDWCLCRS